MHKGTKSTKEEIVPQEDEFLEPTFKVKNRLKKRKLVNHNDIVLDLLIVPLDISFVTKASGIFLMIIASLLPIPTVSPHLTPSTQEDQNSRGHLQLPKNIYFDWSKKLNLILNYKHC